MYRTAAHAGRDSSRHAASRDVEAARGVSRRTPEYSAGPSHSLGNVSVLRTPAAGSGSSAAFADAGSRAPSLEKLGPPEISPAGGNLGSGPVAQPFGLSSLTKYLPSVPERVKEKLDPRRWTINPYWRHYQQDEATYEMAHQPAGGGGGGYHSRERHGAEHTLENIHARTQRPAMGAPPLVGPDQSIGNLPATGPSAMVHNGQRVRGFVTPAGPMPSGRFATPAWHTYSRNVAIAHASGLLPAGVTWPGGAPPPGLGAGHRFSTEYEGSPAGLSVQAGGTHTATPAHHVLTTVQHDPVANQAWIVQHFPQTAANATPAAALVPNHRVAYADIPWFGTGA
jgi:hypothetical protein